MRLQRIFFVSLRRELRRAIVSVLLLAWIPCWFFATDWGHIPVLGHLRRVAVCTYSRRSRIPRHTSPPCLSAILPVRSCLSMQSIKQRATSGILWCKGYTDRIWFMQIRSVMQNNKSRPRAPMLSTSTAPAMDASDARRDPPCALNVHDVEAPMPMFYESSADRRGRLRPRRGEASPLARALVGRALNASCAVKRTRKRRVRGGEICHKSKSSR